MLFIFDNNNNFIRHRIFGSTHVIHWFFFNFCGIDPFGFLSHEIVKHVLLSSTTVLLISSIYAASFRQAAHPRAFNIYIYIYIYIQITLKHKYEMPICN